MDYKSLHICLHLCVAEMPEYCSLRCTDSDLKGHAVMLQTFPQSIVQKQFASSLTFIARNRFDIQWPRFYQQCPEPWLLGSTLCSWSLRGSYKYFQPEFSQIHIEKGRLEQFSAERNLLLSFKGEEPHGLAVVKISTNKKLLSSCKQWRPKQGGCNTGSFIRIQQFPH